MWLPLDRFNDLADSYLLAVGRALALAQNLEKNAQFALGIADLGRAYQEGKIETFADMQRLGKPLSRRLLGELLRVPNRQEQISEAAIAVLRRGTEARNYVAHEAAAAIAYDRPERFLERISRFRQEVAALAEADNLVSCWSFEIQEKEDPPFTMWSSYVSLATGWVLEPIGFIADSE